jgi:hypothetical protein
MYAHGSAKWHVRPDEMLHVSLNGRVDNVESLLTFTVTGFEPCEPRQLAGVQWMIDYLQSVTA